MSHLPTGTVTFVFTDIEESTRLLQQLGDAGYARVLQDHRGLLRAAFAKRGGHELETQGDGLLVAFPRAKDAALAAVEAQRAILTHPWPPAAPVLVRMGLHTGEPVVGAAGYVGIDIHRAARICQAGHGGQILISDVSQSLIDDALGGGVSLRDLGEHRLKDLARAQRLFQIVAPDLPADFPPLRSLKVRSTNLPGQLTSFIGRERELVEVKRLLSSTRLLTLTGSGGCGKTRLALRVAAELLEEFTDGVWLVEFAALSDETLVPETVASALGVYEQPGRPLVEALLHFLRPKLMLLVWDNCEHLLSACAELANGLLRGCPDLRILATSRQALGIAGETRWRVPSLSLPDLGRPLPIDLLTQYEAVRLFIERAVASLPTFTVTNQTAPVLAQVCHRLDGIPLAIELAAARVRVLTVEQLARRLDDRFHLLTDGNRTALPRQQTLLSMMEWSYDLLPEKERALFRRLAVFSGGIALDAAEAVCAGEGIEEDEVLDLLTQLVDKSLVVVEDGDIRYRLLETVRQYGELRLQESEEAARMRARHRDFFVALAARVEPELRGPEQAAWLERLEREHDNLRAALEWSVATGAAEAGLRLTGALWWFWSVRGYYREGRGWLDQALKMGDRALPLLRAQALSAAGYLAAEQGDYAAAHALLEESLAMRRRLGDKRGIAFCLSRLGVVVRRLGDFERAACLYRDALALFQELGDQDSVAMMLNNLGALAMFREDFSTARSLLEQGLMLSRRLRNIHGVALAASNLGVVAFLEGNYPASRALVLESLGIDRELGDREGSTSELEVLGLLAAAQGKAEYAARLWGAAEVSREAIGSPLGGLRALYAYDRYVAAIRESLGQDAFAAAWAEGRAMTLEEAMDHAMAWEA